MCQAIQVGVQSPEQSKYKRLSTPSVIDTNDGRDYKENQMLIIDIKIAQRTSSDKWFSYGYGGQDQ